MSKLPNQGPSRFSPLWAHLASKLLTLSPFVPAEYYDCVVVGAGITGCSTALHLAEKGARVCVLDAAWPGAGTSGEANGQVMADLNLAPATIMRLYGQARAERILRVSDAAPGLVFGLINRHGIACDAEQNGWIEGSPWRGSVRSLEKRAAGWRAFGAPVEMLDAGTLEKLVGSRTYRTGLIDHRGGTVNPLAYTQGLAAAALKSGALVHGAVKVRRLVPRRAKWEIVTDRGNLTSDFVAVATNAYTGRLVPGLRHPIICLYGVQSATVQLPSKFKIVLPGGQGFSDVRKRFLRWSPDGRLIIGGPGGLWAPGSGRSFVFRWIEHSLRQVFPELHEIAFEHHWIARGAAAADLLPRLYEPEPRLLVALGFAGRGIAMGTALGCAIAERIAGGDPGALDFPLASPSLPWGLAGLRRT
jgi:glycine/D-amino acid oxidase-like deaminating enzyme